MKVISTVVVSTAAAYLADIDPSVVNIRREALDHNFPLCGGVRHAGDTDEDEDGDGDGDGDEDEDEDDSTNLLCCLAGTPAARAALTAFCCLEVTVEVSLGESWGLGVRQSS